MSQHRFALNTLHKDRLQDWYAVAGSPPAQSSSVCVRQRSARLQRLSHHPLPLPHGEEATLLNKTTACVVLLLLFSVPVLHHCECSPTPLFLSSALMCYSASLAVISQGQLRGCILKPLAALLQTLCRVTARQRPRWSGPLNRLWRTASA